jgi:hypothetical protein
MAVGMGNVISHQAYDSKEEPSSGYRYERPPFGIQNNEIEGFFGNFPFANFRTSAPCNGVIPPPNRSSLPTLPGCVNGADRQMVIWYGENPTGNAPDIQTIYYHLSAEATPNNTQWMNHCRGGNITERMAIWNLSVHSASATPCEIIRGQRLGVARWIGWSSATHLHYEVSPYNPVLLNFMPYDRIDPNIAFSTLR